MKRIGYINSKRLIEPSFSTWTIQAIYDTGVPLSSADTLAIRVNGNVFWHDQNAYTPYIISPAGVLLATLNAHLSVSGFSRLATLADRYMILPKWDDADAHVTKIAVQEGITELWERAVDDDKGAYTLDADPIDVGLVNISPNGEWIVAMVKEAVTGNGLIFIYKGSG